MAILRLIKQPTVQTTTRRSTVPALTRYLALIPALALALAWTLAAPPPAAANTVTPKIRVSVGYDDNIRLTGDRKKDFYLTVAPGLEIETGPPSNRFFFSGEIEYSYYLEQNEYTGFDGANALVGWTYQPSKTTTIELRNQFSSSFDPVVTDSTGATTKAEVVRGRRDRNTASIRLSHRFGPRSQIYGGYAYTYNNYQDDEFEGGQRHDVNAGLVVRMGPSLLGEVSANASRDDFERSDDIDRVTGEVKTSYLVDQTQEAYLAFSYTTVISHAEDEAVRRAREYQVYGVRIGYVQRLTPTFKWEGSIGYSRVNGDPTTNEMAGSGYPTANFKATYTGQRFTISGYAEIYLGEYGFLGDNTGLTVTQRFGFAGVVALARHWDFNFGFDFIRDRSQQNPEATETTGMGDVDTIVVRAGLAWQVTEHSRFALDYRYLNRDAENDDSDLSQNRVLLSYIGKWPNRW